LKGRGRKKNNGEVKQEISKENGRRQSASNHKKKRHRDRHGEPRRDARRRAKVLMEREGGTPKGKTRQASLAGPNPARLPSYKDIQTGRKNEQLSGGMRDDAVPDTPSRWGRAGKRHIALCRKGPEESSKGGEASCAKGNKKNETDERMGEQLEGKGRFEKRKEVMRPNRITPRKGLSRI